MEKEPHTPDDMRPTPEGLRPQRENRINRSDYVLGYIAAGQAAEQTAERNQQATGLYLAQMSAAQKLAERDHWAHEFAQLRQRLDEIEHGLLGNTEGEAN